jgi:hypothetical protein
LSKNLSIKYKKIMNEETKEKMKAGRKKYLKERKGLVAKIGNDIEIHVDQYQYILKVRGIKDHSYFETIDGIIRELLRMKEKEIMIQKEEKTLKSIQESIDEAYAWIENTVRPYFKGE